MPVDPPAPGAEPVRPVRPEPTPPAAAVPVPPDPDEGAGLVPDGEVGVVTVVDTRKLFVIVVVHVTVLPPPFPEPLH